MATDNTSPESAEPTTTPSGVGGAPADTDNGEGAVSVGGSAVGGGFAGGSIVAVATTLVKEFPAASLFRCSVAVIVPWLSPDRLTVEAASTPLAILTTTGALLPSLNDTVPLSSLSSPATVNGTALAAAAPIRLPPLTVSLSAACSPVSWSSVTGLPATGVKLLPA